MSAPTVAKLVLLEDDAPKYIIVICHVIVRIVVEWNFCGHHTRWTPAKTNGTKAISIITNFPDAQSYTVTSIHWTNSSRRPAGRLNRAMIRNNVCAVIMCWPNINVWRECSNNSLQSCTNVQQCLPLILYEPEYRAAILYPTNPIFLAMWVCNVWVWVRESETTDVVIAFSVQYSHPTHGVVSFLTPNRNCPISFLD